MASEPGKGEPELGCGFGRRSAAGLTAELPGARRVLERGLVGSEPVVRERNPGAGFGELGGVTARSPDGDSALGEAKRLLDPPL